MAGRPAAARATRLLALCATIAIVASAPARISQDCLDAALLSNPGVSLYPSDFRIASQTVTSLQGSTKVEIAKNFEVTYYDTYKVVTNLLSWARETYVLYQCGTAPPDVAALNLTSAKLLQVPLRAVAVYDTSVITFMKLLGVEDRIAYVTTNAVDACMQTLGVGECNKTTANVRTDEVDAVFNFGVSRSNPQAVAFTATPDPGVLNRAEYIKYLAAFFNKEQTANRQFEVIKAEYEKTKKTVADYVASAGVAKPLVAWIYYLPANPEWKTVEQIVMYATRYRVEYVQAAGGAVFDMAALNATYGDGENVVLGWDGSLTFYNLSLSLTKFQTILRDADIVIDETSYGVGRNPTTVTLADFRARFGLEAESAMTDYKFLRGQKLLRLDGSSNSRGDIAWFEEAVARPDVVLADLVAAFHPRALQGVNGGVQGRLVRSVFATPRVLLSSAAQCPLAGCRIPTRAICPNLFRDCNGNVVMSTPQQPCAPTCNGNGTTGPQSGSAASASALPVSLLAAAAAALALLSLLM